MEDFELDTKKLDVLAKLLKKNSSSLKVGIFGSKAHVKKGNSKSTLTNAELGAIHEYGSISRGIPQRSFLRVPISDHLGKELESAGAISPDTLNKIISEKNMSAWLKKIAVLAEGIVLEAFNSGGYGKWPKWKNPHYENNAGMLLVDSNQLRNSITSEVKE